MSPQHKSSSSYNENEIPALTSQCSTESSMSLNNDLLFNNTSNNNTTTPNNFNPHQNKNENHENENGNGNATAAAAAAAATAVTNSKGNNKKEDSENPFSTFCNSMLAIDYDDYDDDDNGDNHNFSSAAKEDSCNRLSGIANSILDDDNDDGGTTRRTTRINLTIENDATGININNSHSNSKSNDVKGKSLQFNNGRVNDNDDDDDDGIMNDSITLNDSKDGLQLNGYLNRIGDRRKQVLQRFYTAATENPCNTWKCQNPLVGVLHSCNFLNHTNNLNNDNGEIQQSMSTSSVPCYDVHNHNIVGPRSCEYCGAKTTNDCDDKCIRPCLYFKKKKKPFHNKKNEDSIYRNGGYGYYGYSNGYDY